MVKFVVYGVEKIALSDCGCCHDFWMKWISCGGSWVDTIGLENELFLG